MKYIIMILLFCVFTHANVEKNVLIINSYHKGFEWSDEVLRGIDRVLLKHQIYNQNILYMDSKRVNSKEYYEKLKQLYKIQLYDQKYDLIITIDTFAYEFLLKNYHEIFTNEPILFSGLEIFDPQLVEKFGLEDRIYGILERRQIEENILLILKLMPKISKIYIINDSSENGNDTNTFIQKSIKKHSKDVKLEYIRKATLEKLSQKFSKFVKNEALLFVRFYNGENNQFYKNKDIENTIKSFEIPTFITDTLFLKQSAFGGKLVNIAKLGEKTAKLADEILNHKIKPLSVEIFDEYFYGFNYEMIKKYNLHPKEFLNDVKIVNQPLSFFQKHRRFVEDMFVIYPILILLIIGLIYNIYKAIKANKKLYIMQIEQNKHQQFIIQQSKLAEIGEIFSSIAHQWKNPLVEITTIAQEYFYTHKSKDEYEQNNPYLRDIMVQVDYMSNTLTNFQKFIIPSAKKVKFDILKAINTTLKIQEHALKYNYIHVNINSSKARNFMVYGYKNEFMQTLLNIFNNAKDQIKEKRALKQIKDAFINIKIFNINQFIIIKISDNAGGIENKNIKKIFDAYFTTKKQGHGIGLYMSRLIIEDKMHGKISVKNIKNGACFIIRLRNFDEDIVA